MYIICVSYEIWDSAWGSNIPRASRRKRHVYLRIRVLRTMHTWKRTPMRVCRRNLCICAGVVCVPRRYIYIYWCIYMYVYIYIYTHLYVCVYKYASHVMQMQRVPKYLVFRPHRGAEVWEISWERKTQVWWVEDSHF